MAYWHYGIAFLIAIQIETCLLAAAPAALAAHVEAISNEETYADVAPPPLQMGQGEYCGAQTDTDGTLVFDLNSAIARALKANRQYIAAEDAILRTEMAIDYERAEFDYVLTPSGQLGMLGGGTAGTGPTVGGGLELSKHFQHGTRVMIAPYVYQANKIYTTTLRATITQPLLRGIGTSYNTSRLQAAKYNHRNAIRNLYLARLKLVLRVIASMYDIIKQEESVGFHQQSYERLKGYATAARLKEKIGLSDSLDTFRADTELRTADEGLNSSQERLQEGYDIFRELLALPLDLPVKVSVPLLFHPVDVNPEEMINLSLSERIEIEQAADAIRENERVVRWAKQNLWPDVSLTLNYNNVGGDELFTQSFDGKKRQSSWGIGFTTSSDFRHLSENLFYETSLLNLDAAERNLEQTEVAITLEVKAALRTLRQAHKKIGLQEKQIKTAEGELSLSQIKFNRGLANNFDVIQAERNLRNAHIAYLSAVIDHINGEYTLLNAVGKLADKPCL